ncbi:MAG TPA: nickel pincer cofactor biosynthesis protein LarC [Abditibacteriaceae bacterium]|nr:nickel pincer cofactor biosynthesis protein LarC [Abditibacteriaceae bacterium]
MSILYFDCFSGISGDMALGALIDCGVPVPALREGLSSLAVPGWEIAAQPVLQSGIHAMDVTISLHGVTDADELQSAPSASDHHHDHEDYHEHTHHHHAHGRSMAEIRAIIEASALSTRVKALSLEIFGRIAAAEAHLHHSTPAEIHFHEIGGVDSLIDICGVAWCLEYLGVEAVYCSALPYSSGFVDCAHGRMPVPAPATLELLKGALLTPTDGRGELVTPTGAGIVVALSKSFGPPPAMTPRRIGHGSGKKRFADRPNILRVVIGDLATETNPLSETALEGLAWQTLSLIETNIDDMNPEFFNHVFERLFAAGALDVWLQPAHMKKNRPALLLSALCEKSARDAIIIALLRETTTLGVRISTVQRASLRREVRTVETPYGTVRVKIADWPQQQLRRAAPEYSDVERLAREGNVPLREVYQTALASAERSLAEEV